MIPQDPGYFRNWETAFLIVTHKYPANISKVSQCTIQTVTFTGFHWIHFEYPKWNTFFVQMPSFKVSSRTSRMSLNDFEQKFLVLPWRGIPNLRILQRMGYKISGVHLNLIKLDMEKLGLNPLRTVHIVVVFETGKLSCAPGICWLRLWTGWNNRNLHST